MLFKKKLASQETRQPLISVVVIAYNMARELPRTIESLLPPFQRGIAPGEVEIIIMDNGSAVPMDTDIIAAWPDYVRYHHVTDAQGSPAQALNDGVALARADWVCPAIDGARMASATLFASAKKLMAADDNPVIATPGYHFGAAVQHISVHDGYDQTAEDRLLASVDWRSDPKRLFDIACPAGSSEGLFLEPLAESNLLVLRKDFYTRLGGYETRFDIPGGGLVNLDFFKRAVEHESSDYVLLIGEGSFHQFHGGAATAHMNGDLWQRYADQYRTIRGDDYAKPETPPIVFGAMTPSLQARVIAAAKKL